MKFVLCPKKFSPNGHGLAMWRYLKNRQPVIVDKSYAQSFEFLGHRFRKRWMKVKGGEMKLLYAAVLSPKAKQRMLHQLKYAKLHRRTDRIEQLARDLNEKVQGWVSYFGKYAGSSMHSMYAHINRRLVKWCMWKYRKFKGQAIGWLKQKCQDKPMLSLFTGNKPVGSVTTIATHQSK